MFRKSGNYGLKGANVGFGSVQKRAILVDLENTAEDPNKPVKANKGENSGEKQLC